MCTALRFLRQRLRPQCQPPPFVRSTWRLQLYSTTNPRKEEQDSIVDTREGQRQSIPECSTQASYPRLLHSENDISCSDFATTYKNLMKGEIEDEARHTIHGRIVAVRSSSKGLFFIDIIHNRHPTQGVCEYREILDKTLTEDDFKDYCKKTLIRGNIISLRGRPYRTNRGELSLLLLELPQLLSKCLHPVPEGLQDKETRIRNRHVDFLINPRMADIVRLRAKIIGFIRQFLMHDQHVEVQTPILAEHSGGAIARPFQTSSVEFPERQITLRIAPEIWLKRLVLGGFDRIFEIGSNFRNEGIDLTHNPEFTTCEFYTAYTDIEQLIKKTEKLIWRLSQFTTTQIEDTFIKHLTPIIRIPAPPFPRIDFIPALESALYTSLPDLESPGAFDRLEQMCQDREILLPSSPTIPHILDKLSAMYLEPQCSAPTFIINHPECLSPLSKSFLHPTAKQRVAARAELYINHQEFVNTYEEENSPVEQRRKFVQQQVYRGEDTTAIDENYLQALEWGLPPTGGWGCGIDRLCMLFSGADRIGDVLSFGTLRNVVSLGHSTADAHGADSKSAMVNSKPATVDSEPATAETNPAAS